MGQSTYIRDGFVSAGNAQVSGSLSVTGGITGSVFGTASWATNADATNAVAGTTNYIPKFTSGTAIGNSPIYDASGDILIGTTTSIWATDGRGIIQVNGSSQALVGLTVGSSAAGYIWHTGTDLHHWNNSNGAMLFGTNNTERMRISNSGVVSITGSLLVNGSSLVAGYNPTPRTGSIRDGVTSVLGDLQDWNSQHYSGDVLYSELSGEAINYGQLCYRNRFGKWLKASAAAADDSAYNMLGICLHTVGAADTATSILTRGYVETTYIAAGNIGDPIFIPAPVGNAGSLTATAPSAAGNVVRVVGNIFWDSETQTNGKWIIHFNPDNTWIEL